MKRTSYLKRASKRFLDDTKFKSPVAAVAAGVRTLESWAEILLEERENETQLILEHRQKIRPNQIGA